MSDDTRSAQDSPAVGSPLDGGVGRLVPERACTCHPDDKPPQPCAKRYALAECKAAARYPLDIVNAGEDTYILMSKGHHDPAEFRKACEFWNGGPLVGWGGRIRHAWGRTVPDSSGDYEFLMLPAKPHARGAYPVTTIIDDAAYDHDGDPCTRVGADGKACGLKPPCPDCGRACHDVGPGA